MRGHTSWNLAPAGAPWVLALYAAEWVADGVWHPAAPILLIDDGVDSVGPSAAIDRLADCRWHDLN